MHSPRGECYLFPDTNTFTFTRKHMKRNFTRSTTAIHLICKKTEGEPAYFPDRYELLYFTEKSRQATIRDYFPVRDFGLTARDLMWGC